MTVRVDPELSVPTLSLPLCTLPAPGAEALLGGRATGAPLTLEGGTVTLTGREGGRVELIQMDGRIAAKDLQADVGVAVNILLAPSSMQREHVGGRGSVLETSLVALTLPLVAIQWRAPEGAPPLAGLTLSVILMPDAESVRYRASATGVRVVAGDAGQDWIVDLGAFPEPSSWTVAPAEGGGIRVGASVEGTGPVTMLLASGPAGRVERAIAAGRHLLAHARTADRDADVGSMDTLATTTGAREIDHSVLWATRRLQAAVRRASANPRSRQPSPGALFWSGVGAAAIGDVATAAEALELLDAHEGDADVGVGCLLPTRALALLLAARTTLTSGEPGGLPARARSLDRELLGVARRKGEDAWAVWSLALRRSADALRHAAPPGLVDLLRSQASKPPEIGTRRLPMAGRRQTPTAGELLERLLFPSGHSAMAPTDRVPFDALDPWIRFVHGEVGAPYETWRSRLREGLSAGRDRGRGTWDHASAGPVLAAPRAGIVLACLAHGLLGLDPDAPSGRVGLAPRFPGHLRSFGAKGLRVGGARVALEYRRAGGCHRYRLDLTEGREPPMVVLCPTIPGTALRAIRVDGKPAELDTDEAREGWVVRIHLPLDGRRVLEVEAL